MVTIKDIAKECNVSITTVSNVLNDKSKVGEQTKQKILEVIQKRGYRPNTIAQGLRSQKTKTIGIIADDIAQFTTPEIIEGIMSYCEKKGYRTTVRNLRMYARWQDAWYYNKTAYHSVLDPMLEELDSHMVDGVIYIAGHARKIDCFPADYRTPAVMAYAYEQNPRVPSVLIDDEVSAYQIVRYLIQNGHRRIGVIGGREDNIHTQKRLLGYQRALYEAEILYNPELVRFADWEKDSGYDKVKGLLKANITAVFCMTDRLAGGVYQYLNELGLRVGHDLAVVGFDNQILAEYMVPGLTTMALPLEEIGSVSAKLLFKQIEKGGLEENMKILIPCTFVERQSVMEVKGVEKKQNKETKKTSRLNGKSG